MLARHVLRNALISTVTLFGLHIGTLLGGAVITETVFAIPGVGRLMIESIYGRDYPVVQGLTLVLAVLVSLVFLVDRPRPGGARSEGRPMSAVTPSIALPAGAAPAPPPPSIAGVGDPRCLVLIAVAPGLVAPYDPLAFDYSRSCKPPSARASLRHRQFRPRHPLAHHLGLPHRHADRAVRDALPVRLRHPGRRLVGYYGGWPTRSSAASSMLVITFPFLVLVIAIVAVLGPGPRQHVHRRQRGRLGVLCPADARPRSWCRSGSTMPPPAASWAMATPRIILRHLLPNAITPVIVYWMTDMALGILLGSSLGYLGLGAQPPTAEWGVLIADGKNFMTHRLVDLGLPRHRHRADRARLQPARRRPRRPAAAASRQCR